MSWIFICALVATFVIACAATWWMRQVALRQGMLDIPNSRSSHSVSIPRGGGVAIVTAAILSLVALFAIGTIDGRLMLALLGGGVPIALVGFLDDRQSVCPRIRFAVHASAALLAAYLLGGVPPLQVGASSLELGWMGDLLGVIAIIWTLNLFNFMDGIDGIAASEAVFVCVAGASLTMFDSNMGVIAASLSVAAASLGFLVWNWPPAKIFMGDVGSGFLGYVLAILALAAAVRDPGAFFVWMILGGVFFVDATVTLLRRLLRGERVYEAHRTHAYQWLSRRFASHRKVTLGVWTVNVFWLLPIAWFSQRFPQYAVMAAAVALTPLIVAAVLLGAGRPEQKNVR